MRIIRPAEARNPLEKAVEPAATGRLTVDLAALVENWRRLAALGPDAECSAVVKADAYGLGLSPVASALAAAGCRTFFVANAAEGVALRGIAPQAVIYVLDGLVPGAAEPLLAARLRPVLASLAEIDAFAALGRAHGRKLEAGVQIDTGMNRLGLAPAQAAEAARRAQEIETTLVMSHLVCAQWPEHPTTLRQIADFAELRRLFPKAPASLCNSSGVYLPGRPHFEILRPGYALYGGNPTPAAANPMRPVARLEAKVVSIREIGRGESIGYDATWTSSRPTRVATLGVGYADGVPVSASPRDGKKGAEAMVAGRPCPFIGRVSMDFVVLDVTDLPQDAVRIGDMVELLGEAIEIDALAARAGTIGYEILTRFGPRYERRYIA